MGIDVGFVNLFNPVGIGGNLKPLGLLQLHNVLEDSNISSKVFDFNHIYSQSDSELKLYNNRLINAHNAVKYILKYNPKIISIYTMCSNIQEAIRFCEIVKAIDDNIITILAGPQATALYEEILKSYESVDLIGLGEGELTIGNIVKSLLCNRLSQLDEIAGIAYRNTDGIIKSNTVKEFVDLDTLQFLKFELIDSFENISKHPIEIEIGR